MSTSNVQPPESYSHNDVQEILHLAITRTADGSELSRTQLWEIATELDIDHDSLRSAERDWLNSKIIERKRQEFDYYRQEKLKQKAVRYAIVNGFFLMINFFSSGTLSWSLYTLLLLGLPLSLDTWKVFQTEGEAYEQAFQRWSLKKQMKESLSGLWDKLKKAWQS
ncbi:MAG: 2TM domain-containing protein [cyanobacterium endosymbiont of Rhopalodia musculus]|uniref:2TM domain-containing protein n=1 Tax=cyanobacterium endosymbiont of Epithemia clementina EcSB TaxID=3034674 RepID=UPI002480FC2C|nr:2TM domain-containing protein [cyanobacterium endosymbiont of Epithemia clementina EcSB]WGT67173.1 2TM domain-containing protein [cyanobacterium endosymbiont of Epithemia clementina EcSB]